MPLGLAKHLQQVPFNLPGVLLLQTRGLDCDKLERPNGAAAAAIQSPAQWPQPKPHCASPALCTLRALLRAPDLMWPRPKYNTLCQQHSNAVHWREGTAQSAGVRSWRARSLACSRAQPAGATARVRCWDRASRRGRALCGGIRWQ
jgi:hypothetical protein